MTDREPAAEAHARAHTHIHAHLHAPTHTHTYVETPQQKQRGLQADREDQTQDGGSDEHPDAVRLRKDDNDRQGNQHGHPQQGGQMGLQRP